jgi:hypothetical protein
MRRVPHVERPRSVVALGTEMGVFAKASLVQRDRRSCLCSLGCQSHGGGVQGAVRTYSGLQLRHGPALVMVAQVVDG